MSEDLSTPGRVERTWTKTSGYTIISTFQEVKAAGNALDKLKDEKVAPEDISVVTRDRSAQRELSDDEKGLDKADASLLGSLGGGTLGAALGWLVAGGALVIPGIGPIVAAGTLAGILGGAVIGGSIGGIAGALMGSGVSKEEAGEYEEFVKGGQTVITVHAADREQLRKAGDILLDYEGQNTRYYDLSKPAPQQGTPYRGGGITGKDNSDDKPAEDFSI
jgi:hypothetical protein